MRTILLIAFATLLASTLGAATWYDGLKYCSLKDHTKPADCLGCHNEAGKTGLDAMYWDSTSKTCKKYATGDAVTNIQYYHKRMISSGGKLNAGKKWTYNANNYRCQPMYALLYKAAADHTVTCANADYITLANWEIGCGAVGKDTASNKVVCPRGCAPGYHSKAEGTGDLAAVPGQAVTAECLTAVAATDRSAVKCEKAYSALSKGCDQCMPGYAIKLKTNVTISATINTAAANAIWDGDCTSTTIANCTAVKNTDTTECLECRDGCFFNGTSCQCTQLVAPAPVGSDFCMETDTDSKCTGCFNDGNSTEGFKALSANHGNCQTAIASGEYPTGAEYSDGQYIKGGTPTERSFYCPSGQYYKADTTFAKGTCATNSSAITDCKYHATKSGATTILCTMCNDGKQQNTAETACEAGTAVTNAKNFSAKGTVHECNSKFVKDGTASCRAWDHVTTKTLDPNCREVKAYGSNYYCHKCKWGYYFAGAWCAKGTSKSSGTSSSSSSSTSSSGSTTTKAAAGINMIAAGFVLAIAAAFN